MKQMIRVLVFSYLAMAVAQKVIGGFAFGGQAPNITFLLVLGAVWLLNLFGPIVVRIIGLPSHGPGFLAIMLGLNLIVLFSLTYILPTFSVFPAVVPELIIFGVVLPSKSLSVWGSLVYSVTIFVVVLYFFSWLCQSRKK